MFRPSCRGFRRLAGPGVLILLAGHWAGTATPLPQLDTVTVVGKSPQPLAQAPAAVLVISREDLETGLAFDPGDVFRDQPGISVRRDPNRFGYTAITVRGLSGNRVLLETDGVPAASTFSIGSFSDAGRQFPDPELVRRIEILKGPASTLYGSDAIAGVVATTTVDPAELLQGGADSVLRLRTGYASDSHMTMAGMTVAARFGDFDGMLAVARREGSELQNAYRDLDANPRDFVSDAVLGRAVIHGLARPLRLTIGWERQTALTDVDSLELSGGRFANTTFLQGDDMAENWRFVVDQVLDSPAPFDQVEWRLYRLQSRIVQATSELRRVVPQATPRLAIDREFRYEEAVTGGEITAMRMIGGGRSTQQLTAGMEIARTRVVERRDGLQTDLASGTATTTILGEVLPVRDFPISEITKAGLYLQDQWRPHQGRWTLIPALRADWYRLKPVVDAMYAADNPNQEPVAIRQQSFAPKLGASVAVGGGVLLFLQYSHGFRSQPFEDVNIGLDLPQFNTRAIPNPDLRPEKSDSIEIGARVAGRVMTGSVSAYYSRYRDFIESRVNIGRDPQTGTTLFQSQNIGKARIQGVEASLTLEFGEWIAALERFSGTFSAAWTRGDDVLRHVPINTVDPARGTVGFRYRAPSSRWQAQMNFTAVDRVSRVDESRGSLFRPAGFTTIDLSAWWRIGDRLRLNTGIFNLQNSHYHEWADVRGRGPEDPLLELYQQAGRNFSLTLTATF